MERTTPQDCSPIAIISCAGEEHLWKQCSLFPQGRVFQLPVRTSPWGTTRHTGPPPHASGAWVGFAALVDSFAPSCCSDRLPGVTLVGFGASLAPACHCSLSMWDLKGTASFRLQTLFFLHRQTRRCPVRRVKAAARSPTRNTPRNCSGSCAPSGWSRASTMRCWWLVRRSSRCRRTSWRLLAPTSGQPSPQQRSSGDAAPQDQGGFHLFCSFRTKLNYNPPKQDGSAYRIELQGVSMTIMKQILDYIFSGDVSV